MTNNTNTENTPGNDPRMITLIETYHDQPTGREITLPIANAIGLRSALDADRGSYVPTPQETKTFLMREREAALEYMGERYVIDTHLRHHKRGDVTIEGDLCPECRKPVFIAHDLKTWACSDPKCRYA